MYQQPHMPQPGMMPPQQGMPNQMQFRKRPSEADPITKHIKKKRPTDRNMPAKIEAFVPECKLYSELTEFEKKLDGTIMRKRLDIQEALGKPTKIRTTLRVFVSNTSSNQQQGMNDDGTFDMNSGNAPSWTLKIDGKLLDKPPTKLVTDSHPSSVLLVSSLIVIPNCILKEMSSSGTNNQTLQNTMALKSHAEEMLMWMHVSSLILNTFHKGSRSAFVVRNSGYGSWQ